MKLTTKRIIEKLRVAKFKDKYLKISFWELWGWSISFKIMVKAYIKREQIFKYEPKINIKVS